MFIKEGKAVTWFDDEQVIVDDPVQLASQYDEAGADALIIFDLSSSEEDHDEVINILKRIHRAIRIPFAVGGNIERQEDVKKILYSGAKRVILNFSKEEYLLVEEASKRFGKEKISASLSDFDSLYKHQHQISSYCSELIVMDGLDLYSVLNVTDMPCILISEEMNVNSLTEILKSPGIGGLSGKYISQTDLDIPAYKEVCKQEGLEMTFFESKIDFSAFTTDANGLIPVVTQHYKTLEVLMVAYMNEESFNQTIKTGKMTYYSRSRKSLWVKGETSGHFQFVKSLAVDCDQDTLLAKVDQVGVACHTGNTSCFFTPLVGNESDNEDPRQIFTYLYDTIADRKENPKEGSYTNYLFEKGIDKILKKLGEEATEIVIAAKNPNSDEMKYELADFLYHAMVLMVEKGITWEDIVNELSDRK